MRTATLDLNSRGSFVDDLNSKPGIVMCRDALLHRSHEIQPAFYDSERKAFISFFFSFFFLFSLRTVRATSAAAYGIVNPTWDFFQTYSNYFEIMKITGTTRELRSERGGLKSGDFSTVKQSRFSNRI